LKDYPVAGNKELEEYIAEYELCRPNQNLYWHRDFDRFNIELEFENCTHSFECDWLQKNLLEYVVQRQCNKKICSVDAIVDEFSGEHSRADILNGLEFWIKKRIISYDRESRALTTIDSYFQDDAEFCDPIFLGSLLTVLHK
jgi:hypothetical protein